MTDFRCTIKSCVVCKPPKRHPGCHDRCEDYRREKDEYEKKKTAYIEAVKGEAEADAYVGTCCKRIRKRTAREHDR